MKKVFALFAFTAVALLAWVAAGSDTHMDARATPRRTSSQLVASPVVPAQNRQPERLPYVTPSLYSDSPRPMIIPVAGVDRSAIHDMFNDVRGNRRHEAVDIMAPRGTPVIATDDGVVKKLFTSVPGGLTVYEFDPDERYCYYYAHLDRYADGLHEGQLLHRGEVLGYVGTTGNAAENAPHLHFAVIRLEEGKQWWKGSYVNPYPLLVESR
jgi:murein DD-endopeptidase MepM/ murein hydrolase activator NlpD